MKTKKLKELREEQGYTQKQVAKLVGVTITYLSLLENGKRNMSDKLKMKFAIVYKCDVSDIFKALNLTNS